MASSNSSRNVGTANPENQVEIEVESSGDLGRIATWFAQNMAVGHSVLVMQASRDGLARPLAVLILDPTKPTEILCRQREPETNE